MSSQQQNSSAMVLYIPFTFGDNGDKKGTTEKQVFWHMRNLRWGFVDHIDKKERVIEIKAADGSSYNLNVRSWFVHFRTWNAPEQVNEALHSDHTIQIPYDDYGHYWNVKMYVPKQRHMSNQKPGKFTIVKNNANDDQVVPDNDITSLVGCWNTIIRLIKQLKSIIKNKKQLKSIIKNKKQLKPIFYFHKYNSFTITINL